MNTIPRFVASTTLRDAEWNATDIEESTTLTVRGTKTTESGIAVLTLDVAR